MDEHRGCPLRGRHLLEKRANSLEAAANDAIKSGKLSGWEFLCRFNNEKQSLLETAVALLLLPTPPYFME